MNAVELSVNTDAGGYKTGASPAKHLLAKREDTYRSRGDAVQREVSHALNSALIHSQK